MDAIEARIEQAASGENPKIPGGSAFVVNGQAQGTLLYSQCFGRQSLDLEASPTSISNTAYLASAGKFITHVAVLQLAQRGQLDLDEPVYRLLPELEHLPIISNGVSTDPSDYTLRSRSKAMTIRHLLTHSSGIAGDGEPLIEAWRASTAQEWPAKTSFLVKLLAASLLFEPGGGWHYGHSVHFLQLVIGRASGLDFTDYIQKNIFDVLGMSLSAYHGTDDHEREAMLQAVERRADGTLVPAPANALAGLACSIEDFQKILTDLISPESKLLSAKGISEFFAPSFPPSSQSLQHLRMDAETYAAPTGITSDMADPPVNFTCGGALSIKTDLPNFPSGTLTWNGMPNIIWALHREKGLAAAFIMQLLPEDDEQVTSLALEFFRCAWSNFG